LFAKKTRLVKLSPPGAFAFVIVFKKSAFRTTL